MASTQSPNGRLPGFRTPPKFLAVFGNPGNIPSGIAAAVSRKPADIVTLKSLPQAESWLVGGLVPGPRQPDQEIAHYRAADILHVRRPIQLEARNPADRGSRMIPHESVHKRSRLLLVALAKPLPEESLRILDWLLRCHGLRMFIT
jgi:hypothetical protein